MDINLPVKQAFHVLYEQVFPPFFRYIHFSFASGHTPMLVCVFNVTFFQDVPMAPLWDYGKSQFVGVLSAMDFILILKEVCG